MIATTIEQSNKLLELNIDPSTADMFWLVTREPHLHVLVLGNEPLSNYDSLEHYPAWSLSALSEILKCCERCEVTLRNDKQWNIFVVKDGNAFRSFEQRNGKGYGSQLDAYYDVVCWLKEHKFI